MPAVSVISMVLLVVISLFKIIREKQKLSFHILSVLFLIVFFLHALSFFYSENISFALKELEQKLSFLIFPIIFFALPKLTSIQIKSILNAFVLGSVASGIILLTNACIQYFDTGTFISYSYYTALLSGHPSYLGLYYIFAFFIVIYQIFNFEKVFDLKRFQFLETTLLGFILFTLYVNIFLVVARMPILVFLGIVTISTIFYFYKKKKLGLGILLAIAEFFIIAGSVYITPLSTRRFTNVKVDTRKELWIASIKCIDTAPFFGHGIGDRKDKLMAQFKKDKLEYALSKKFNAHNQCLDTSIAIGIVGSLFLFLIFCVPLIWAIKEQNYIYIVFLLASLGCLLTESMLERQAGIFFILFFNCFFASQYFPNKIFNIK